MGCSYFRYSEKGKYSVIVYLLMIWPTIHRVIAYLISPSLHTRSNCPELILGQSSDWPMKPLSSLDDRGDETLARHRRLPKPQLSSSSSPETPPVKSRDAGEGGGGDSSSRLLARQSGEERRERRAGAGAAGREATLLRSAPP
jgi:hypothetical protein